MILHFSFIPTSNTLTEPSPFFFLKPLPPNPFARLDDCFRILIDILNFYENSFSLLELSRFPVGWGMWRGTPYLLNFPAADAFYGSVLILC